MFKNAIALVAVVLAFGRNLPGAKALYPLLSLDGRIRLPVKWWYVVALALVPLVASAAARWQGGQPLSGARRLLGFILLAGSGLVLAWQWPETMLASAGPVLSLALLALLVFDRTPRRLAAAACVLACALLLCHAPLLLALLDRPPEASPRVTTGRLLVRLAIDPHPVGGATFPSGTIRGFYRRGPAELWPLLASTVGTNYAFDEDPDGAYADEDRAIRKALDAMPWPERAAELRIAGVTGIVTDEALGEPYREARVLNERQAVRFYLLDRPLPSVRFATRVVTEPSLDAVLAVHRSADFDPATDVVLEAASTAGGERLDVRPELLRETADRLVARVEAPASGVLVWSRTYFSAWWATVDGVPAEVVRADGHLVGVRVPAGIHVVEVGWSARPVVMGTALAVLGLGLAAWLRRSRA